MKTVAQILNGGIHPLALQPFFLGVFQQNWHFSDVQIALLGIHIGLSAAYKQVPGSAHRMRANTKRWHTWHTW